MRRILPIAYSALFLLAAVLYFALLIPQHLHHQEQYQLFLYTSEYAAQVMNVPGGVADYVGRFLTQFFFFAWPGACIIAALLTLAQITVWLNMKKKQEVNYILSFLPSLILWIYLCYEMSLLGTVVAFLIATLAAYGVEKIRNTWARVIIGVLLIPLLYFFCGPLALLFLLIFLTKEIQRKQKWLTGAIGGIVILALTLPIFAHYVFPYSLEKLATGVHYFRIQEIPVLPWIAVLLAWVITLIPRIPAQIIKSESAYSLVSAIVFAILAFWGVWHNTDLYKEEVMKYDYMCRMETWNNIMITADKKVPNGPMTVTVLNLAMAKTGYLGNNMFNYYQNGTGGLFQDFQRDYLQPLPAAEAFYQLGMTSIAQQYFYEAMEAIPDFQKSGRIYKRLAECSLINGDYQVAKKYLKALQHTQFYAQWANETLPLLNDKAVENHPVYGPLRLNRIKEDFFFSSPEMSSMLGRLFLSNEENRLAFDYLMAWAMLARDLKNIPAYFNLGSHLYPSRIPAIYQQALLLAWAQTHDGPQGIPWPIQQAVLNDFQQFAAAFAQKQPQEQMRVRWGHTFWYYNFYKD